MGNEGVITETAILAAEGNMPQVAQDRARIDAIKRDINIADQNATTEYGARAQNEIAKFADITLQNVRTRDTGEIGDSLAKLTVEIRSVTPAGDEKKGFLSSLFGAGQDIKKQLEKMKAGYDRVETNVDKITSELKKHQQSLLKDIQTLDGLYDKNLDYFNEITAYIAAGEERLREFNEVDIPKQRELAESSGGDMERQRLNDMTEAANRFDKRLHELRISRVISIQTAPQIRMIQGNDRVLDDKIQSSIVNAIPLWKNQIVIALTLQTGKSALEAQRKVSDLTNEMLIKNSEMLKTGSIEIAKESERSVVSIEAVRKSNENLITTINEILSIQEQGKTARRDAEAELVRLEDEIKTALKR